MYGLVGVMETLNNNKINWELQQFKLSTDKRKKQAGTVLGQAQLKLELELCFTSFNICCIKLIKLVKLDLVW